MNGYGYTLLQAGKVDEAIAVFRQNVAKYPASWNTYDSLGEGLAQAGKNAEAVSNYQKARSMVRDETNQKRIDGILSGLGAARRGARSSRRPDSALLRPECDDRFDPRRAARRHVAGGERRADEQCRHPAEDARIRRAHLVQHGRQQARQRVAAREPQRDAACHQPKRLARSRRARRGPAGRRAPGGYRFPASARPPGTTARRRCRRATAPAPPRRRRPSSSMLKRGCRSDSASRPSIVISDVIG